MSPLRSDRNDLFQVHGTGGSIHRISAAQNTGLAEQQNLTLLAASVQVPETKAADVWKGSLQGLGVESVDCRGPLKCFNIELKKENHGCDSRSRHRVAGEDQVAVEQLLSRSTSMGPRGLLCVASSHDGQVLAASGQHVISKIASNRRSI